MADEIKVALGLAADSPARDIRRQVFIDEQHLPEKFDETDDISLHAVLYRDGSPLACGRAYEEPEKTGLYHLGRFAVLKPYRGQGCGSAVLAAIEAAAGALGATSYVLSAQLHARGFYLKHGYVQDGAIYELAGVPHVMMRKSLI